MTKKQKEPAVVEKVIESVSPEEINQIKTLRNNSVQLTAVAEKAYDKARTAELEAQNYILQVFNKYKLSLADGDNLTEDGNVVRGEKKA